MTVLQALTYLLLAVLAGSLTCVLWDLLIYIGRRVHMRREKRRETAGIGLTVPAPTRLRSCKLCGTAHGLPSGDDLCTPCYLKGFLEHVGDSLSTTPKSCWTSSTVTNLSPRPTSKEEKTMTQDTCQPKFHTPDEKFHTCRGLANGQPLVNRRGDYCVYAGSVTVFNPRRRLHSIVTPAAATAYLVTDSGRFFEHSGNDSSYDIVGFSLEHHIYECHLNLYDNGTVTTHASKVEASNAAVATRELYNVKLCEQRHHTWTNFPDKVDIKA